jgi:hypothetical protein
MTNQLTHTETTTSKAVRPPTALIPSDTDERPLRPSGARRWIVIAGSAALAAAVAIGFAVTGNDSTEPAERRAEQRPAYLIVQDEIDKALAERNGASDEQPDDSFDVAEQNRFETLRDLNVDDSFDVAEQNRFETLRDLNVNDATLTVQDEIDAALAEPGSVEIG